MNIIGVIPARKGSKGIPSKNIKLLCGKPLIYYTINSALKSKLLTSLVVSTDSISIAEIAKSFGARVPFIRPETLATDDSLAVPTIKHAVLETERNDKKLYDYIIMLQPTCPFTTSNDIDKSLARLIKSGADSIISVVNVGAIHPYRMKTISEKGELIDFCSDVRDDMMPRQKLPSVFLRSGDIYAVKRDILIKNSSLKGRKSLAYVIPEERAINIDTINDWKLAEVYLNSIFLQKN